MGPRTVATLLIKEKVPDEFQQSKVKYMTEKLSTCEVKKSKTIPCEETVLTEELEACIKQYDVVILVGGIDAPHSSNVFQALSKVFHQKLVCNNRLVQLLSLENNSKHANIPMYAKVLESSMFSKSKDVRHEHPVVYIQGLLLISSDFELLKSSFTDIIVPFLNSFHTRPILTKSILVNGLFSTTNNNSIQPASRTDNVNLRCVVGDDDMKVTITSGSMSSLLNCENGFRGVYEDTRMVEDDSIPTMVYNQMHFPHVRNSIECIEECLTKYGPDNVFLSFNGGKDCTVLLHLTLGVLKRNYPNHPNKLLCVYVENANAFPELNKFVSELQRFYELNMLTLTNSIKESLAFILESKPNIKACLMGSRRTDPYCENLQAFQMTDPNWPQIMRISPLLEWHYSEIWDYLQQLEVPYCSLYDLGYTSLGGVTNTVKNPSLLLDLANEEYLPAYKLLDASQERNGRIPT